MTWPWSGGSGRARILEQAIEEAREGTGSLVEIVGEPGAGKSRLVAWLRSAADDMVQLSTVCERYDASTPYHVVGRLLRTLIGLPPEGNGVEVAAAFLTHLEERAPAVLPRAPLIATALGLTVPETAETRDIDEGFRRARMAEAVIDLLGELLPDSGLLTVEDAHFMDEASADLFGYLAALVGPSSWLICVTRRDGASAFVAPEDHATRIALGPLEVADATELAHLATADAPIPQHRIDALVGAVGRQPAVPARPARGGHRRGRARRAAGLGRAGGHRTHRPPLDRTIAVCSDGSRCSVSRSPTSCSATCSTMPPASSTPHGSASTNSSLHDGLGELSFRSALLRDCAYDGLTFRLRRDAARARRRHHP